MGKTLFKLDPNPTFDAVVQIPVHGKGTEPVRFTFKHRTKSELAEFMEKAKAYKDAELIPEIAAGWELEDEFNPENVSRLVENYSGSGLAVYLKYLEELSQAKRLN